MPSPIRSRTALVLALATALAVFGAGPARAADAKATLVQIRIVGTEDRVLIEMPAQLLQFLAEHSKGDMDVGTIQGKKVQFPMADLVKLVQGDKARDHEVLFFSAKDDKGQTQEFYVKTTLRKPAARAARPTSLAFSVREGGKEKLGVRISLDTIESFAKDWDSGEKGQAGSDDFGPLVRASLASAKELGSGLLLRVEGKSAELTFSLE